MFVIEAIYPQMDGPRLASVVLLADDTEDSVQLINMWLATQTHPQYITPTYMKRYWFDDGENKLGAYVFLVQHDEHHKLWVEE
jgi:hypothetical protein